MPPFKQHCADCVRELGKPYERIHQWLDEYAKLYVTQSGCISMRHWLHRHHKAGVEEARAKWGDDAARAAEIHILADYAGMGLHTLLTEAELEAELDKAGP